MMPWLIGDEKLACLQAQQGTSQDAAKELCVGSQTWVKCCLWNRAFRAWPTVMKHCCNGWTCFSPWYDLESSWNRVSWPVCKKFLACVPWDGKIYFMWGLNHPINGHRSLHKKYKLIWAATFVSLLLTADAIRPAAISYSCHAFPFMIGFTLKVGVKVLLYSLAWFLFGILSQQ